MVEAVPRRARRLRRKSRCINEMKPMLVANREGRRLLFHRLGAFVHRVLHRFEKAGWSVFSILRKLGARYAQQLFTIDLRQRIPAAASQKAARSDFVPITVPRLVKKG